MSYNMHNYDRKQSFKICRYCKMQIPSYAKTCPYCYRNQFDFHNIVFRIIGFLVIAFCVVLFLEGTENHDKSANNEGDLRETVVEDIEENKEEQRISFTYDDLQVEFIEGKIEENRTGDACLVLYFDFTNNDDDNNSYFYSFTTTAFQDGIELENSLWEVNEETKNCKKEIQPGTTVRIAKAFVLTENRNSVNVEIEPFSIWNNKKLLKFTIDLTE